MKTMNKVLALAMTLVMLTVLLMTVPAAYADGGITVTVSGEGKTVTVTVTNDAALDNVGGIRFVITPASPFTFKSETHYSGFGSIVNADTGNIYIDTDEEEGIDIPAGNTLVTAVFETEEELEPGDYTFSVSITEAFDAIEFEPLSINGGSGSGVYNVPVPATPTPEVTPAPTEKPAEPTPAPTEKPAEPTPAPTEKPAEPTPAPATPTPKPVNPVNPTTGDESNLVLYVVIMVATLALGAVTFVVIRKGNKA